MLLRRTRLPVEEQPQTAAEAHGPQRPVAGGMSARGNSYLVGEGPSRVLAEALPALPDKGTAHLISEGDWSLHNMLGHVSKLIGPASCVLTSWGISTRPVQLILDLVRDGSFTRLDMLLDHRVRLQAAQAFQLLLATAERPEVDARLTKIHAKVFTLTNDRHQVAVGTSANLTVNPRVETYWVCTDPDLVREYTARLMALHARSTPLL